MQTRFRLAAVLLTSATLLLTATQAGQAAASHHHGHGRKGAHHHENNIIGTLNASGHFKHLTHALAAAGLTRTLESGGPYTLFAPNDAAFSKVGKNELDDWMKNPKDLKQVLLYHVVRGNHDAASLQNDHWLKTMNGENLPVSYKNELSVGGAMVSKGDMKASNGTVHEIDEVLRPRGVR